MPRRRQKGEKTDMCYPKIERLNMNDTAPVQERHREVPESLSALINTADRLEKALAELTQRLDCVCSPRPCGGQPEQTKPQPSVKLAQRIRETADRLEQFWQTVCGLLETMEL